jgi:hypothetical protein
LPYDSFVANSDGILLGGEDGFIYHFRNQTRKGGAYTGEFVTAIFSLNKVNEAVGKARVDGIRIVTEGSGSYDIDFVIGIAEEYTHAISFPKTYDTYPLESTWDGWKKVNKVGRYFQIKCRTTGANQPFSITEIQLRFVPLGLR